MIRFLVQRPHEYTVRSFVRGSGSALRDDVRWLFYDRALGRRVFAPGTYVFTDLERLNGRQRLGAADLYARLAAQPDRYRVLNDPARALDRVALWQRLPGQNFGALRVDTGAQPTRWPVFLRRESDHDGGTELLSDKRSFDAAVATLPDRAGVLAVEFLDTRGTDGLYRKYSAFRIGDATIARHVFFSQHWQVKNTDIAAPAQVQEELTYVQTNPHADAVARAFRLAGIDYGRIDYALHAGRLQVWEINTNPMIMSQDSHTLPQRAPVQRHVAPLLVRALRAIDSVGRAPFPWPQRVAVELQERLGR